MIELLLAHYISYFAGIYFAGEGIDWNVIQTQKVNLLLPVILLPIDIEWSAFTWYELPMCVVWIIIADQLFYWLHRAFHSKLLYRFHKDHHRWIETKPYAALVCHPLEHIICNLIPLLLPIRLLDFSIHTAIVLVSFASFNTTFAHSFKKRTFHSLHHERLNVNFGLQVLADRMYGTLGTRQVK